jgi:alkylation response protein AidB-like acyl-CoA dehydrogenase
MSDEALLHAARSLAPRIRAHADESEAGYDGGYAPKPPLKAARRIPAALVAELARAGLFRMLVPRSLGGGEVTPATSIRAIEAIAQADGAAGWCVMAGALSGLMSAYLEEDAAREVYGDPLAMTCGVFAPMGKALDEGDHWRVSGRWSFASGVDHAAHLMGGVLVMSDAGPRIGPDGEPLVLHVLLRADQTRIMDTWNAGGLRGTGSHDMAAGEALVPKRWSASLLRDPPRHGGELYRFPLPGLLSLGVAAVALGVARQAITALGLLATEKRPVSSKRLLAHRELVQAHLAEAEGLVRSARAFLFEATGEVTESVAARGQASEKERALLRLAATQATQASARAVDLMYHAGGGSSIHATSPLQRHFHDVHVVTQHGMVAEATYAAVGRVLLGLSSDVGML